MRLSLPFIVTAALLAVVIAAVVGNCRDNEPGPETPPAQQETTVPAVSVGPSMERQHPSHPVVQRHRVPVTDVLPAPHVLPAEEVVAWHGLKEASEIVPALTLAAAPPEQTPAGNSYLDYAKASIVRLAELSGRDVPDDLDERGLWLVAWFALEEPAGKGAWNNPANTTLKTEHVVSNFNSVGVRNYDSFDNGVDAFVRTLWVGGHARGDTSASGGSDAYGYGAVVRTVLDPNATFADYAQAVRASSWCSGCYGPLPSPTSEAISKYAAHTVPGKD